jgi:tetratricopeptide (TPR) repeat protein
MNRFLLTLSFIYLVCFSTASGQNSLIYQVNRDYQKGVELFEKQKYGAAYKYFRKVIDENNNEKSLQKSNAEYYSVLCAIQLDNDDAEILLDHFVTNNPESQYINNAWFEMAKYKYSKKNYKHACQYFEKVNTYLLSGDEKAEYFFKKGYCYFQIRDYSKARVAFFEIKDIDTKYLPSIIIRIQHIFRRTMRQH